MTYLEVVRPEEENDHLQEQSEDDEPKTDYKLQIVWFNVFRLSLIHTLALWGMIFSFWQIQWKTLFLVYCPTLFFSLLGITAGAHRLWSHRSYRAHLYLRIFFMLANTIACQDDIYTWCRNHRSHHRFSETEADPHDSRRGFFFSHIGWLLVRKHPQVKRKGAKLDLSDLIADPVVMFQKRYFLPMAALLGFILPALLPHLLWGEDIVHAFLVCTCFRYVYTLHTTWLVNSVAHMFGNRPYDRHMEPRENFFATFLTFGESYHNYHHSFAWDYSASEFSWWCNFNYTTMIIDGFAWLGWVTDRKTASRSVVAARRRRTGEPSLEPSKHHTIMHQVIGITVGAVAIWLPCVLRLIYL